MTVHYDMAINAEGWQNEETLRRLVDSVLQATLQELGFDKIDSELSLVFTNDADIREINGKWRHIDKPTNVLSFPAFALQPGQEPGEILGDIVIARETVAREAAEEHKSFDDHLSHLVVHGLLHLMGYDHQNDEEAEQMETLERKILASLGISDPYL
ncbi:Endoribonuclease YbeY [Bartonella apihabitans]|uniref:Endoribonuclease YbeY n=1 Tax=Bartonella apihabitans TaxID=2750929 RepID=A0A1U9M8L4_9HYPH|nr:MULTISPECIES: rRNA maturation RNase YbeY [Bartonella]AQT41789.1 putative rRNA maturation factor [Bartonella apihabitans]AQT44015.1 putative rRNA maturation factor [Bartonella apihabitans]MBH9995234.1 rRNA maturation RNase YbeY [Bartonella sp. P0291]MBH9996422.1 rRNA maturation RNase YbeY [Bartonella sp. M0192]MBH9998583.1 rRNA maturation RNase YbeY [Bartonella sp. M0191]